MTTKACLACGESQPLTAFDSWSKECQACLLTLTTTKRQRKRHRAKKHARAGKAKSLRRRGFTLAQYDRCLELQNNCCAICHTDFKLLTALQVHADHDHFTGLPRGVLCGNCNYGLGMFRDNPERLEAAVDYLMAPPAQ